MGATTRFELQLSGGTECDVQCRACINSALLYSHLFPEWSLILKVTKKVWGRVVFSLGMLWLVGGVFGYVQGKGNGVLILIFCGIVLARMGWGMTKSQG